ncbi:glutaredoxin family protein [Metallibacterium sp.]|jgi:glutaredoxin|uniref:glutaredoxin family protein n=2 Tax=Metallibacterium sp. TaxID=2940281 RepID=UPI002613E528|nr:glutaredoxin family protein [Metallibacterium sp.]
MQQSALMLYRRDACLLCALAEALLGEAGVPYAVVDIESSPVLEARYGTRIPVLARADGAELGWPFDAAALRVFVARSA